MHIFRKYTEEDLRKVIKESKSFRSVLLKLGVVPAGGNYITLKKRIKFLNIDISHFLGQGHLKGKKNIWHPKRSLDEILVENSNYINSSKLKERLLKEKLLQKKCYNDDCPTNSMDGWRDKKLIFELEHINGNKFDNRIENLILLCPNCHSQTKTYRGKNKGVYLNAISKEEVISEV